MPPAEGNRLQSRILLVSALLLAVPLAGCADNDGTTPTPGTSTVPTTGTPAPSTPVSATPVVGSAKTDDFEAATLGALPAGWTVAAGNWSVVTNASAPKGAKVLLSDQTPLGETSILYDAAGAWGDLEARVMFNVLAGEKGQAGGIVFRYVDDKNHYVVRYNHNEMSWNLFRTIDGNRQKFDPTAEAATQFHGALNQWTELRLEARGGHVQVFSGPVKVIDYTEQDASAPKSGKIGLWTRYDSKTQFDDFSVAAN